jgi:tetrahydromethanopterin S-methyltransferase subunit F
MAPVYDKKELIDLFERVWERAKPSEPVSRKKLEEYVEDVRDDGELVKSDAGEKNLTGIEVLAGVAIGVLSSIIYDILKVGAKKLFEDKTDEEILQDVNPTRNATRREISLNVIAVVRKYELDSIEKQIAKKSGGKKSP